MERRDIRSILEDVRNGVLDPDAALDRFADLPSMDLGHTRFDTHRALRRGVPEVVYGEGKSLAQTRSIIDAFRVRGENLIVTRLRLSHARKLCAEFPEASYCETGRVLFLGMRDVERAGKGMVLVVSAGTSDLPVAREAELCARYLGNDVELLSDVGVAGMHRLLDCRDRLKSARVCIVVAGMEGALPSFVASLTDKPVLAVPTSVGYGASLGGFTALFGMLNACSGGVSVVNIDNGFGAAYCATLINRL